MFNVCLKCFTDKPQTHFLWKNTHINVSPFSVKTSIAWLFLQKWTISLIPFGNTLQKSRFNQIKTTTAISFWANYCLLDVRVTATTLECNTPAQNVFTGIIMTVWQNRQTWHYFITAVCHAVCGRAIYIQYCCWYPQYWIFEDAIFNQLLFLRL